MVDAATPDSHDAVLLDLDAWQASMREPFDPVSRTFAWVAAEHAIPLEPARDLLAGVRMDLGGPRFRTWNDLHWYSYCVAGTVGLMIAPVLGCTSAPALTSAVDLGVAMQLTNILRDVAEDARMGRVYLPDQDLNRFGVSRQSILDVRPDGDFAGLIAFEIERARRLYEQAYAGIPSLSRSGQLTTLAGGHLYREILRQIERQDYDVFRQRATVPTSRKMREMQWVMRTFFRLQCNELGSRMFPFAG
jgi:phytoene synthase